MFIVPQISQNSAFSPQFTKIDMILGQNWFWVKLNLVKIDCEEINV